VNDFGGVLWAGFGWATIEVVHTLVTGLAVRRLLLDTSAKAAEARRLLLSMGWLQYGRSLVPLLGAVERAGVSLLHIGFTLLLGWNPWLVLVTMPAHSTLNLHAHPGAERQRVRGALGAGGTRGVPGLDADLGPSPSRAGMTAAGTLLERLAVKVARDWVTDNDKETSS
jgi:hypothetical protein